MNIPRSKQGTSGRSRWLFAGEVTKPANSGYATLLDTTLGIPLVAPDGSSGANPLSGSVPTPGTAQGQALGRIYSLLVSTTGQNATVEVYYLNGAGAWTLDSTRSTVTVTAGAADASLQVDAALAGSGDCLILLHAGATAPTHSYASISEITKP